MKQGNVVISEKKGRQVDEYPAATLPIVAITILAIVVTAVAGGVLWWITNTQTSNIARMQGNIAAIEQEMSKLDKENNLRKEAERFTNLAKSYSTYQKNLLDWNNFLTQIKDNTLKEVTYNALAVDRTKRTFRMDGVAPSYRIVAEQLNVYMKSKYFDRAILKSAILRPESDVNSRVAFSFELKPAADAFAVQQTKSALEKINGSGTTLPVTSPMPTVSPITQ